MKYNGAKWEYKMIERSQVSVAELNDFGEDGWQLVQMIPAIKKFIIYLKREKQN
jgi:hypothetical protein